MTTIAVGNRRLLRLAKCLDTADEKHIKEGEPKYFQGLIKHTCGTPACALGHYETYCLEKSRRGSYLKKRRALGVDIGQSEFRMTGAECMELFAGTTGMDGHSTTAKKAAEYLRAFVKRRQRK